MTLHSMFDFALHMPSNAMWVATLAGVLFHPGVEDKPVQAGKARLQVPRPVPPGADGTGGTATD